MIDPKELEEENQEDQMPEENTSNRPKDESILEEEFHKDYRNFWTTWFTAVNNEVLGIRKNQIGEHDNAYYLPKLKDRLQNDIKWLPLWSCILRDRFGYGKIAGSSAPCECQIKNIKQDIFPRHLSPMRPDAFVNALLKYLSGRALLIEAKVIELENAEINQNELVESDILECKADSSALNESSLQTLEEETDNDQILKKYYD